ncbi:unnamed protein product [Rotaria sordida]|uniref:G-protein coupled receptors family 1 profile domain-containing protein n=1 Tax=Rotaria sordida TaxID=392033 RepID=A0A819UZK9_9BILA|nr:unnamed protein product [Rotaria sordida]
MDNLTIDSFLLLNNTNDTCPAPLLWTQAIVEDEKAALAICIIASVIHATFWFQLIFSSSIRQKSMQWIYAYLLTDIFLLFRFYFSYTLHTTYTECNPSRSRIVFICYLEAILDNYFNILKVYILFILNVCRYVQIVYNQNVYEVHKYLLILAHVLIYVIPLIVYIAPCLLGWTDAGGFIRDTCVIFYANTYIQIFNTIFAFALPIFLNILVIYSSIRHVRIKAALQKSQHYVSAREKLNRSLVIQFICFYTVWGGLWSPNIIVYQASINKKDLIYIVGLLNYIDVAIDPIIVAALDFRLWHAWRKHIIRVKRTVLFQKISHGRVKPSTANVNTISARTPRQKTTTM